MSGWGAFGDAHSHPLSGGSSSSSSEDSGGYRPPSFGSSNNQSTRVSKGDDPLASFGRSNDSSDSYSFSNQSNDQSSSRFGSSSNDSARITGFGSSSSSNQSNNQSNKPSSNSWASSSAASSTSWNSPDPSANQWNNQSNYQSSSSSINPSLSGNSGQFSNPPSSSGFFKCGGSASKRRLVCMLVIAFILVMFIAGIVVASDMGDSDSSDSPGDLPSTSSSSGGGWSGSTALPTGGIRPFNPQPWLDNRLSSDVIPTHYDVQLQLDLDNAIYTGVTQVTVTLMHDMDYIVMHSMVTGVTSVKVDNEEAVYRLNTTYQYLIIDLPSTFSPEAGLPITITYAGTMKTDSDPQTGGLFLSAYEDASQDTHLVMSSLLQPAFARYAFPCFDEPEFKATWDIQVTSAGKYETVLSNMPHRQQSNQPDTSLLTQFETTPQMSAHLISIHVSDYIAETAIATCQEESVVISVWTPPFIINSAVIPVQIAKRQAEYFCDYFDLPYMIPKEDHVVIPNFPLGGLESWGLMSYSTKMLYDSQENTVSDLLYTVGVLSHEQSHQYFGDLVTAGWWTDLALTESFSTYFEFAGGNASNADLMMGAQFLLQAEDEALVVDSSADSRPLITSITSTNAYPLSQGVAQFPYQKAGSLIRMIRSIIGENAFHSGVKSFLTDFSFNVAYSGDIFDYLTTASHANGGNFDVGDFMNEWMTRAGYPVLTCASYPQGDIEEWKCTQQRFFTYQGHPIDNTRWELYVTSLMPSISQPNFPIWYHRNDDSLKFTVPSTTPFVKLNVDETGFFRVLYDASNWKRLAAGLQTSGFGQLDADDRVNLFDDAWVFAQQDMVQYPVWGNLTRYLVNEMDPLVWMKVSPQLQFIFEQLPLGTARGLMSTYLRRQMNRISRTIDVSEATNSLNITRAYLMDSIGVPIARMDYESRTGNVCPSGSMCDRLNDLYLQVSSGKKTINTIDPAVVAIMFEVGTNLNGLKDVHARYRKASSAIIPGFPGEADRIRDWMIQAMGSTTNRVDLITVVGWALDEVYIYPADAAPLLKSICSHQIGRDRFLRMLDDGIDDYLAFWKKPEVFGDLLEYILNRIRTTTDLNTMRMMLTGRTIPSVITKAFARGEVQANKNIEWQNKYLMTVMSWIQTL